MQMLRGAPDPQGVGRIQKDSWEESWPGFASRRDHLGSKSRMRKDSEARGQGTFLKVPGVSVGWG